jgi:PBS lyase HEAT-like repeat-containing protein
MNDSTDKIPEPVGDDPLDQLLSEARWPDVSPKAQARLANHWQDAWSARCWSAECRGERLAQRSAVVAIAASLLIAAVVGWGWLHRGRNPVGQPETVKTGSPANRATKSPAVKESQVPRIALRPLSSTPSGEAIARSVDHQQAPRERHDTVILSRPPNKFEELLIAAWDARGDAGTRQTSRSSATETKQPVATPEPSTATSSTAQSTKTVDTATTHDFVETAVARLVADPKADPTVVAAELRTAPLENEMRLLMLLGTAAVPDQTAAIRLLGELGDPASVPALLRAAGEKSLHSVAIGALSRIADAPTIDQLVRDETSTDLQRVLLAALLGRDEPVALGIYLNYVDSKTYGPTALAATEQVSNPPMERLFSTLHSTSEFERLAAARVLGRIDGPATTERLIALLEEGQSRQEACVALLSSRGEEAANFVSNARTNPTLATLLQAASVLLSHESQPRS